MPKWLQDIIAKSIESLLREAFTKHGILPPPVDPPQ